MLIEINQVAIVLVNIYMYAYHMAACFVITNTEIAINGLNVRVADSMPCSYSGCTSTAI